MYGYVLDNFDFAADSSDFPMHVGCGSFVPKEAGIPRCGDSGTSSACRACQQCSDPRCLELSWNGLFWSRTGPSWS